MGSRRLGRQPGTEFLDGETGRQKPPIKCANACGDQDPGIEWPEMPAEAPYLTSYRKRAVCKGWMVVLPVYGIVGAGTCEAGVVAALVPAGIVIPTRSRPSVNLHLFLLSCTLLSGLLRYLLPRNGTSQRIRMYA